MCKRLWDLTEQCAKTLFAQHTRDNTPLSRGDVYGRAVFPDSNENRVQDDQDGDFEPGNWQMNPVRELNTFRNFYTPVFMRPLVVREWQKSICTRGLTDIYTTINGPLIFKQRVQTDAKKPDYFDPIYHHPPILIYTKNEWMF